MSLRFLDRYLQSDERSAEACRWGRARKGSLKERRHLLQQLLALFIVHVRVHHKLRQQNEQA